MGTIKLKMIPSQQQVSSGASGIHTVCNSYYRVLPDYGVEFVDSGEDLSMVHAGVFPADIAMLHGLYFTDAYSSQKWEWRANAEIVHSMRYAHTITVPSEWVAQTIRRDFRQEPYIVDHGVFWDEWQHEHKLENVVLWGKNRTSDVCTPEALNFLASQFRSIKFLTTFKPEKAPSNVIEIGIQPYDKMRLFIQKSQVVLSTIKETWGIMYIEAAAAGTPTLSVNAGHVPNLIQHGVGGYVYKSEDLNDMATGLEYCLRYRSILSENCRQIAKQYSWDRVARTLIDVFELTLDAKRAANG